MPSGRFQAVFALFALLGYVVLLVTVPRAIPLDVPPTVISASSELGYNAPMAYRLAAGWSLAMIALAALFWRKLSPERRGPGDTRRCGRLLPGELILVFVLFFAAYFPWFVARHGPLMEDHGFILSMFRMACGQVPFRDFEFLYGPSMVYSLGGWSQVFGASMTSYFGLVATQEAVQFTILAAVLQIAVPDRKQRLLIFLILFPFLVNTLMGVNWSAGRRLVPVLAILLAAARPFDLKVNLAVAAVIGLHATYSHDYAAAALVGIGAIYATLLFGPDRRRSLRSGPIVAVGALAVWAAVVTLLVGPDWSPYLDAMRRVVSVMSLGHVSFAFYWTLNALALFALLALACVVTGASLPRFREGAATGDLAMVGMLVFAIVTLKSGLNRADHWHLAAAFLGLFLAFLLPLEFRAVRIARLTRRAAMVAMTVAAVSYVFGIYASGRNYAGAYYRGAKDVLSGVPTSDIDPASFRDLSTEVDRTRADPPLSAIGAHLALPENAGRPVLYYGTAWSVAPRIGACPGDYKLDALMYSGFEITEAGFLEDNPDAFVVMRRGDYERIFGLAEDMRGEAGLPPMRELAAWLATVHYRQGPIEARLLDAARDSVSAAYIRENFELVPWPRRFGPEVLLQRRPGG